VEATSRRSSEQDFRPSILAASWRYRWLVLACVVLSVAAGVFFTASRPPVYSALAQLVVDPATTVVSEGAAASPDRYVAVQVVVLRSAKVAERAVELAEESAESPDDVPTVEELLVDSDISATEGANLIEIAFEGDTREKAILGANSLAEAYQDIRESEAVASATAAIARVDALIESADEDIESIAGEIALLRAGGSTAQPESIEVLENQSAESLERLGELQAQLREATSPDEAASIRQGISDIATQISMLLQIRGLSQDDPELAGLIHAQEAAINRRALLSERRDTLAVDAELVGSGVVSYLPATSASGLSDTSLARTIIVMAVFGGLVGAALAYFLATRRRRFTDRHAPEAILGAPLLADIPDFDQEPIPDLMPVVSTPHSVAAEAFRFALAAIDLQMSNLGARSAVVVSAGIGTGKSVVTANSAAAAVRQGYQVLVVDADFGNQALTTLITGSDDPRPGLTEATRGNGNLERAIREIPLAGGALSLLSRGNQPTSAVDFFRAEESFDLFRELTRRFDRVLIDSPSMLHVAYGSLLARHADAVIVLVSHGDDVVEFRELVDRLEFVGKPIVGYIYNRAPLRSEMTRSEGSLRELNHPLEAEVRSGRHGDE
jgi:Mrp family chromosome partitioning ATPase